MSMQSLLGTNHCPPLSLMYKSYILLEETKERINEFSIGYMINPTLVNNKALKDQETKCIKNKFVAINQPNIGKIILKKKQEC